MADISVSREVRAEPDLVWAYVSDVTRMGEWSPETTGCRWVGGASGAAVGSKFRGANRNGWHRWSTTNTVVACEPGRSFAFETVVGPVKVARWGYEIEPTETGCTITETWHDQRGGLAKALGGPTSGVSDRLAHNRASMETTLERLAAAAEAATASD